MHIDLIERAPRRHSRQERALSGKLLLAGLILITGCHSPKRPTPGTWSYPGISTAEWEALEKKNAFTVAASKQHGVLMARRQPGEPLEIDVLMMSGGGQNGAFGAGILAAWPRESESHGVSPGTLLRPEFEIVTGVSTGAILVTGAFLGDPALEAKVANAYTTATDRDIYTKRSFLTALFSSGAAKQDGLKKMLEEVIGNDVIDRVAAEQEKGRSLWIGTSNMDSGKFQTWNLTHVALRAKSGSEGFYDLYRDLILASAAVPLFFEPVYINGYMHVDGGIHANIFAPGLGTDPDKIGELGGMRIRHYMIRNGKLDLPEDTTAPSLVGIGKRALASLMLLNDAFSMARIRDRTKQLEGLGKGIEIDSYLAYIEDDFTAHPSAGKQFDPVYMSKLEDYGRKFALESRWLDDDAAAELLDHLEQ